MRAEWHEKVLNLQMKIDELEIDARGYIDDLEVALALLSNASILYDRLGEKEKNELLQIITKRVIINEQGEIITHELNSPFEYLSTLAASISSEGKEGGGSEQIPGGAQSPGIFSRGFFISVCRFLRALLSRFLDGNLRILWISNLNALVDRLI